MAGAVNFNNDQLDDPVLPDGVPSFEGGQFSNLRANLLQPNQSKTLGNCDIDKLGKLRTRRGTALIGTDSPSGNTNPVQGLISYQTPDTNYIIAAQNGHLWKWTGSEFTGAWEQIALGGILDDADILIERQGLVNNGAGYPIGTTVLVVDGFVGVVGVGDKLYFKNNIYTDYYEYTITAHTETAGNTTGITLEAPGLVTAVVDNWIIYVLRPAKVNHGAGYPAGATTVVIDGYTGIVGVGERLVFTAEHITHTVTARSGGPPDTTSITFTPPLQADFIASPSVPITFAAGDDKIFFCDGTGPIYQWDGTSLLNLTSKSFVDYYIHTLADMPRFTAPMGPKVLVWFQNRLLAMGIAAEPDAIYYSDFFDAETWDNLFQKHRIGGGESDPITGALAWTDYNLIVTKKNSLYMINLDPQQNPDPTDLTLLVASYSVKQLHKRIGCPAPMTLVQVGGGSTTPGSDVFFVDGDKKVHSVRRVMAAETQQEVGQAVSLPIQDVLDTINVTYIEKATAFYHNEHYILGIPSQLGVGGTRNDGVVAYNLLTQSWCGIWSWSPTCFAMRTDLGAYSRMIFGDYLGNVVQWYDDQSLDEETDESYEDMGDPILTKIITRALTFGDAYSYKSGFNVEFEFDESVADVQIRAILDKVMHPTPVAAFSTLSEPRLRLPFVLPRVLPGSPDLVQRSFDLQRFGQWRELQFQITSSSKKLAIRSIRVTGFMDTMQLQSPIELAPA